MNRTEIGRRRYRTNPETNAKEKRCGSCGLWKPYSEYHKNSASADGAQRRCKLCANENTRKYHDLPPSTPTSHQVTSEATQTEE